MFRATRLLALALLVAASSARAQSSTAVLPAGAVLTNYDRVLIGQEEALESGAFVARVADSTAGWYNPAGLALVRRSVIGASATGYELNITDLGKVQTSSGGVSLNQLPSYFGAVLGGDVIASDKWRIGFSATKPTSWTATINGATLAGVDINYSSSVSISTLVPTISAAWALLPTLRVGAGFGVAITSISQSQILSEGLASDGGDNSLLRTAVGTGTTWGGQGSFGVQWDITDRLVGGISLRTPTFTIIQTGALTYQSVYTDHVGRTSDERYFNDPNATFTYKLPFNLNFGLAWREPTFDVEVDMRFHSAIPQYVLLASSEQVHKTVTDAAGNQTTTSEPFPGLTYGAAQVWNIAIGGRYQLSEAWSLHGGFYTDLAPTDPSITNVFRSVNLFGLTAGAKLKGEHLSGSLGLGFSWGSSQNFDIGQSVAAEGGTRLSILSITLLYALAYRF